MYRYNIKLAYRNKTTNITVVDPLRMHDLMRHIQKRLEEKTSVFLLDVTSMEQQPQTPRLVNISTADEILITEVQVSHDSKITN